MRVFGLDASEFRLVEQSHGLSESKVDQVTLRYGLPDTDRVVVVVSTWVGPYTIVQWPDGRSEPNVADAEARGPVVPATTALLSLVEMSSEGEPRSSARDWRAVGEECVALGEALRRPPWGAAEVVVEGQPLRSWVLDRYAGSVLVVDRVELAFTVASVGPDVRSLPLVKVDVDV